MAKRIQDLDPGTPPYPDGTLFELAVPTGEASPEAYDSVYGDLSDIVPQTKLEPLPISWDSNTTVEAGTFPLLLSSLWASATIESVTCQCQSGTFTAVVQINGVSVTFSSALNVSSVKTTTSATANNTLATGGAVSVVISSPSGSPAPTNAMVQVNLRTSLN